MYNDKLDVSNKIIKSDDILSFFDQINEIVNSIKKEHEIEEKKNEIIDFSYQTWKYRFLSVRFNFFLNFTDNTEIRFDNYNNFRGIFVNRLTEIKSCTMNVNINYSEKSVNDNINNSIRLYFTPDKMELDLSFSSRNNIFEEPYNFFKNVISNADVKYDRIIKKKSSIINSVALAKGLIPSIIIVSLLTFTNNDVKEVFKSTMVLFPFVIVFLGFFLGNVFGVSKLYSLYNSLIPDKKYSYYDSNSHKSVYKDDIDSYVSKSEILVGKNTDNLLKRNEIGRIYDKYIMYIPLEIFVTLIISVIVVVF